MKYNPPKGRRDNSKKRAIDTVKPGSAQQAMLIKQDAIIAQLNAIVAALATASSIAAVNSAAAALPVLVPVVLE
jgi:hypothetical protein